MELEIQAVLKGPEFVAQQANMAAVPVLTKAEQQAQRSVPCHHRIRAIIWTVVVTLTIYRTRRAMDLELAKEDLSLRRRHRRMVADMAAKNKRQNKIKSRK